MSTTRMGRSTPSFIRSRSDVPPATKLACPPCAASTAPRDSRTRTYWKGCTLHFLSRPLDRGHDVRVSAAAADVAAHVLAYLLRRRGALLAQQPDGAHDLPGRAIATLKGVFGDEGLLHGVQTIALRQTLDGDDL